MKNKYILVVDDNTDNRVVISEMLYKWDMNPITCASAIEALSILSSSKYNFIMGLIDICMPGTSGTELAKQIKNEKASFSFNCSNVN